MAILKIARMGHPILLERAAEVEDPTAPEIRQLAADMLETMRDAGGTGLAAPQVHVPLRVVLYRVAAQRATDAADDGEIPLTVLINPVLAPIGDGVEEDYEACLSVPGLMGLVPRYTRLRCRALGLDGRVIDRVAAGFHARVLQHECDHLDGILYPTRIRDLTSFGFVEEIRRSARDEGEQTDD